MSFHPHLRQVVSDAAPYDARANDHDLCLVLHQHPPTLASYNRGTPMSWSSCRRTSESYSATPRPTTTISPEVTAPRHDPRRVSARCSTPCSEQRQTTPLDAVIVLVRLAAGATAEPGQLLSHATQK